MTARLLDKVQLMRYALIKAKIATVLEEEMSSQVVIAAPEPVDFKVFTDRMTHPDASDMPCLNIYNDRGAYDRSRSYTDGMHHTYRLNLDLYAQSTQETDAQGDAVGDSSQLACAILDYLHSQVYGILRSEHYFTDALLDFIQEAYFTEWVQFKVKDDAAETVVAIRSTFELQFNEPTEIITGDELQQFVVDLNLNEKFISPFLTVNLGG
jgi:hypothetical protein